MQGEERVEEVWGSRLTDKTGVCKWCRIAGGLDLGGQCCSVNGTSRLAACKQKKHLEDASACQGL